MLSDPDKRAKYDQFGFNGPSGGFGGGAGGFSGFDINDILKDLFGAGFDFGGNGGGFGDLEITPDLNGIPRVVEGVLHKEL